MNELVKPPNSENPDTESFRDHIGTVDDKGKRTWIYPKKPEGRFYRWRTWVSAGLLLLLFAGPFLKWKGIPLFLFNILERKFIIFGITFWPQDFHLFVLAMLAFMVFLVLFTVIYGRVWCGWACPQTVFMEMVFRKIEYWIEGSANQQKKLNKAPWTGAKIRKKTLKFAIFLGISFLIGNLVMAYIVGIDELAVLVTQSPFKHWGKFTGVVFFSGIFFFVFSYFREQACIAVCPYGRLQGVMLGKDSIVVAYDFIRGEPRGKRKRKKSIAQKPPCSCVGCDTNCKGKDEHKQADAHVLQPAMPVELGDCVDCKLCVQVCPTGIDIRDGTQMECVNCTACIDACDAVMDKLNRPRGLIRYASHTQIVEQEPFRFTPRIIAYSVVLIALLSVLGFSLGSRSDVEATILRTKGMTFQVVDEGYISNLYNLQLANKTTESHQIEIRLKDRPEGRIKFVGKPPILKAQGLAKGAFFVELPRENLKGMKNKLVLEIYDKDGKLLDRTSANFLGPMK